MDIKAALFDVDGTLVDTTELILQSFEHSLKTHNAPLKSRKEILKIIGPGAREAYRLLVPDYDDDMLFNTHVAYQTENIHLITILPHAKEVITILKDNDIKVAAVTNRSLKSLGKSLNHVGLPEEMFDMIVAVEDIVHPKPSPEGINKVLSEFKIDPKHAIMVGDTAVDIQAGKAAGVMTFGITTGFFNKERLIAQNPDHLIHDLNEVLPFVL